MKPPLQFSKQKLHFGSRTQHTTQGESEMTTATQKRAAVGGEFGANGEWYEGGKFINTVADNAKRNAKKRNATRKQEIAPYVWEVPPEGKSSLYRQFAGIFGNVRNDVAVLRKDDGLATTVEYCGRTLPEVAKMIEDWNAGVRWI